MPRNLGGTLLKLFILSVFNIDPEKFLGSIGGMV